MDDLQGQLGDRFEILAEFPAGATGAVWLVRARGEGIERAVKILRPELSSAAAVAELGGTLEAMRQLGHPNILVAEDTVQYSDRVALVMRRVSGEDLRTLLERRYALSPAFSAHVVAGVGEALAAAHEIGLAHGDVKPSNVMLETDPETGEPGAVLLTDFGIAALSARGGTLAQPAEYWAPEAAKGQPPVPASDVYALGILLYEAITGQPPFTGAQPEEIARLHRETEPARIPALPDALWDVITACLVKQPEHRPTAAWVVARLRELGPMLDALPALAAGETVRIARIPAAVTPKRPAPAPVIPRQVRRIAPDAAPIPAPVEEPAPERHGVRGARDIALAVFGGVAVFGIVIALVHFAGGSPASTKAASSGDVPNLSLASASASAQFTTTVKTTLSASPSTSASHSASPSASAHTTAAATTAAPTHSASSVASTAGQTSAAATTTSAAPTMASTTPASGPVTVTWQCSTNHARGGLTKTACIGIGSDNQLYVRATFTFSYGQNVNDLSIAVFDGNGYMDTSSENCDSASCSMTSGPYSPPAGQYEAVAGIDDYAHNENSPTIYYPGS